MWNEITYDQLRNIPFYLSEVVEENDGSNLCVYYSGLLALNDYDDVAHYLRTAIMLFGRIRNKKAKWVNLESLWVLRNCIRENINHGLDLDCLIYGGRFDPYNPDYRDVEPLTKSRFNYLVHTIRSKDPFASV